MKREVVKLSESDITKMVKKSVNTILEQSLLKEDNAETFNDADIVPINETNAKRVIDRHSEDGYVVISACRGGNDFGLNPEQNPHDKQKLANINNKRSVELLNILKQSPYSYTPVYGGFIENKGTEDEDTVFEKSFIIYNRDKKGNPMIFTDLKKFGIELCNKYRQDAILVKEKGKQPMYIKKDGSVDIAFDGDVSFNDFSQEYFTDLHKNTQKFSNNPNSKPTRFSFTEAYVNPKPQCFSERHIRKINGEIFA